MNPLKLSGKMIAISTDPEENDNAALRRERDELRVALENLVAIFIDGTHYNTQNPYTRPQVKAALKALGKD